VHLLETTSNPHEISELLQTSSKLSNKTNREHSTCISMIW
jgi:hypothetical protein